MDRPVPATEITALLGRGTRFEGKLFFEGRLRIDGELYGEVRTPGVLIIGDGAVVDARIDAAAVIIRGGEVRADVRASQSIELYVPARVSGQLHAPEVFMDKGVQFSGRCTIAPLNDGGADSARADAPREEADFGAASERRRPRPSVPREEDEPAPRSLRTTSVRPLAAQPLTSTTAVDAELVQRRGLLEDDR